VHKEENDSVLCIQSNMAVTTDLSQQQEKQIPFIHIYSMGINNKQEK